MPPIANLYFRTAIVFLILGISIGLHMSISGNHAATGAHAHANLLGWVTMAIFGGYHALNPQKAARRLATIQYAVYTFGVAVLIPSLYLLLSGNSAMEQIVSVSWIIAFAGVLLFAVIIFSSNEPVAAAASPAR